MYIIHIKSETLEPVCLFGLYHISDHKNTFVILTPELQIIFTVVSVFTNINFNLFSNLMSPFSMGTPEIQWLSSIFLMHNWSPIYSLL